MDNKIIVVSAPSGTGKTTIVERALAESNKIGRAVTHTTRPPRLEQNEINGKDYYFVSRPEFEKLESSGEFIETANTYDHWYATSKKAISDLQQKGRIPILVIDVQGANSIRKLQLPNTKFVFLKPPSFEELLKRLFARASESNDELILRLKNYDFEINQMQKFDAVITNNEIEPTVKKFLMLIDAFTN